MKYDTQTPYISSNVLIRKEDKIALVLRSNTRWMNGYYGLPAGKIEKDESALDAACREALEESGISVEPADLKFIHLAHRKSDSEWIDIYFEALSYGGEPYNAEPGMHGELAWFKLNNLPTNTIMYVKFALEEIEAGHTYSQFGWD